MIKKFVSRWFYASLGSYTKETGVLFKKTKEEKSQRWVDFESYSNNLTDIYNELDEKGYDVINIIPINMGQSESCSSSQGYVGDVGFSITRGAVVIGRKREE